MDYTQSGSDILLKQPDFGLDDTLVRQTGGNSLCAVGK